MHRLFFVLILLSLTCGSYAAEVNNLYQAQLAVDSRDEDEREQLAPQLLHQVILKVVGNSALLNDTDLQPVLKQAGQYVQQFEYVRTNDVSADLTQPDRLALKISFDPDGVNRLIQGLGLPVWGKIRPDILAWVAINKDQSQQLLSLENADSDITPLFETAADKRGLPILLPLMDLQDLTQISFDTVWQQDEATVQLASARYGADMLLMCQATVEGDIATIHWQLVTDDDSKRWQSQGTLQAALEAGVGQLADILASQYSQTVDTSLADQRLTMHISDVIDYGDFTRLMSYLRQLDYITDIRVINLNQQMLNLDIAFTGNVQVLQRTLAVGRMLTEDNSFDGNGAKQYRLLP